MRCYSIEAASNPAAGQGHHKMRRPSVQDFTDGTPKRRAIMRRLVIAGLLAAPACLAQEPAALSEQPQAQVPQPPPAATNKQTITVPAGTRIALSLENPIQTKLARRGDPIRAVTVFPVSVGSEVAIPEGTHVEGVLDQVNKHGRGGYPDLQVHFTGMLFANGYTLPLEAAVTTASTKRSKPTFQNPSTVGNPGMLVPGMAFQQGPVLPPPALMRPPSPGPRMGVLIGVAVAGAVASILWALHKRGEMLLETGWQFEMVLQKPLTVDVQSVAAAPGY